MASGNDKQVVVKDTPVEQTGANVDSEPISEKQKERDFYQETGMTSQEYQQLNTEASAMEGEDKLLKGVAEGVATYFGGPAAGMGARAINDSGKLDKVYEGLSDELSTDLGPVGEKAIAKLNDSGAIDKARDIIPALAGGASGASNAASSAGTSAGSAAASQTGNAASNAASNTSKSLTTTGNNSTSIAKTNSGNDSLGKKNGNQAATEAKNKARLAKEEALADEATDQSTKNKLKKELQEEAQDEANKKAQERAAQKQQEENIEKKKQRSNKRTRKKIWKFLLRNPWVLWIFGGFILIFLIIIILFMALAGAAEEENSSTYLDATYDFSKTHVNLTNSYGNEADKVTFGRITLADFLAGMAYAELYESVKDLDEDEQLEAYKAFMVVAKALAFNIGGYDYTTMEIYLQSGTGGLPYCDVDNGCLVLEYNGRTTYVSKAYATKVMGTEIASFDKMPAGDQTVLYQAYNETKYLVMVPEDMDEILTKYTYGNIPYTNEIKDKLVTTADKGKAYEKIIDTVDEFNGWKIYNIEDYALQYKYASGNQYWWPIGGSENNNGKYDGKPTATLVSSKYGPRTIDGYSSYHKGVDIASSNCNSNVIIASRSGTVTTVNDGCASVGSYRNTCGGGYGNYVILDHGDGTQTVYAHMWSRSVSVKVGDTVAQGQKIGLMGSSGSSTGCHLHFEIRINNEKVDPLQYISVENPRPASSVSIEYAKGNTNAQSVCLSLKNSGFSNNAVAALMVNIHAESSFRPDVLGDSGTSYGLCQWHNGRFSNLRNYCADKYSTIECQLSFLIYELQKSYKDTYSMLLSNNSAYDIAKYFCINFERPYDTVNTCTKRANNFTTLYANYVNNGCQ